MEVCTLEQPVAAPLSLTDAALNPGVAAPPAMRRAGTEETPEGAGAEAPSGGELHPA